MVIPFHYRPKLILYYKRIMPKIARLIHAQAEDAREKKQDFLTSLQLVDQATIEYQKEHDLLGLAEVQATRANAFKHLYQQTNFKPYLLLALHSSQAGVDIAKASHNSSALALPYFKLGEIHRELKQYKKAVSAYQKAVDVMATTPPQLHHRPAVLLNFQNHLYTCLYLSGNKTALAKAESTAKQLAKTKEPSSYHHHVWLSGAYLRLAEMLLKDNPPKAKSYLKQAKKIIDSDPQLKLRSIQWQKLANRL